MSKITIENLTKTFESEDETVNVFDIKEAVFKSSETTAIVGSSGSGKSTLLQILAGLDKPTSGNVFLTGKILTEMNLKKGILCINKEKEAVQNILRRNHFGFIYQNNFFLKDLNVIDNILIAKKDNEKAMHLLNQVGLSDKSKRTYRSLSGGERQRVSICRALINSPKFVFADEPTGSLDYKNKEKVWDLFLNLRKENPFGLIMVTHDENLASIADNKYILSETKLVKK